MSDLPEDPAEWLASLASPSATTDEQMPIVQLRALAEERARGRCEWPACDLDHRWPLELAHLKGKQMGGSRYRDNPDNVALLCKYHHDWLDGRLMGGRREVNEDAVRKMLGREWKDRR